MPNEPVQSKVSSAAPNDAFGAVLPWILFISFAFVINYLTRSVFGPMLPDIESELGINHASSTRLLFYISVGYMISMFLSGPACAKIRSRVLVAASLAVSGLMFQIIAVTADITLLAALFFTFGFVAGQYFNASMSILRGLVRPSQWSRTVSINEFGPNIAFIIGPIVAELGSAHLGWRGTVSVLGWCSVAMGVAFFLFARGGDEPVGGSVSFRKMVVVVRNKNLWLFTWFIGLAIGGQFAPYSVMTLHMIEDRAIAPETAAFLLAASRLAMPAGALLGGYLSMRIGMRTTLKVCTTVYAAALLAMSMPMTAPFIAGLFIQPLFTAMLFPALYTLLAEAFPAKHQPMLLSTGLPVASFFGIGIMPGILGMFGDHWSFSTGFLALGIAVAASLLLLRYLPRRETGPADACNNPG